MVKDPKGRKRVVVTGIGAIAPVGLNADEYWQNLVAGKSGIDKITLFDASDLSCKIAGEVKGFDPLQYIDRKTARHMARFTQFAVAAGKMAIDDAELDLDKEDRDRIGMIIGNGIGGLPNMQEQCNILETRGGMRVTPFFMTITLANMAASQISIHFGLKGYTSTTVTACAAGTQAIGEAAEIIRQGKCDIMVTGGTEAGITGIGVAGFCTMKALTTNNEVPAKASRPFDANRDGFIPGEGAGILILESLEHALNRGANILCEVVGYGCSADAHHVTAPEPNGAGMARGMKAALDDAFLTTTDVDYINAHGTSTPLNDVTETRAIKRLFEGYAYKIPISSTKSMIGHLLGGSGGAEAVAVVKTIVEGVIHPTINYETADAECDLDYVPNTARKKQVKVAMSNSFGFGGQNACLILKAYEQ
ncbi:MAG: beta-ketoacyl-ACP synthase II [Chloroflexi bacterium]|jgi:3-oxoacyl-[acyl-carrier-protein] synthase II|nr:beta-ketoacyl-ACP synthase II [Chloroflexota bacterium]MBT7079895.1 beta-ketoacyl-ACP synthase II [Chloroflexota bacterium]